jgi:hypothetical protein
VSWTLLYYVKGDQGAWEHCYCVTQALEPLYKAVAAGLSPQVRDIAVQCRREPADYFELEYTPEYSWHWVQAGTLFEGARRFRMRDAPPLRELGKLPDLGVDDMSDFLAIAAFVRWALEGVPPDEKTILVFWGHGGGAFVPFLNVDQMAAMLVLESSGASPARPRYDAKDKRARQARDMKASRLRALPTFFAGINAGLRSAGRERVDIVAFNSCFMSCIEAAYQLRNVAAVLVGSEESTPFDKWDHEGWIGGLSAAPGASVDSVAASMVATYKAETRPECTLSAVRLGRAMEAVATAFADFTRLALEPKQAQWDALVAARAAVAPYGDYGGTMDVLAVDIQHYFSEAASRLEGPLRDAARNVVDRCHATIIASEAHDDRKGRYGSQGLSVFFPRTRTEFQRLELRDRYDARSQEAPEFVKVTGWREFLDAIWKHTR